MGDAEPARNEVSDAGYLRLSRRRRCALRTSPCSRGGDRPPAARRILRPHLHCARHRRPSLVLHHASRALIRHSGTAPSIGLMAVSAAGKERLTRNPGLIGLRSSAAPWSSATALTKLRPRPLPGVVRLLSPR